MEFPPTVPITYSIAGCSEHSGKYVAENIRVDKPLDQSSRWSGAYQAGNVKQWMLLKTEELCVLKSVTFGKFHRAHPCNMKEFKLLVGLTESNMTEVLHAGLKNDSVPETFLIRYTNSDAVPFPTRYLKIVPLSAHGQSFHTSIWYVSLSGIVDQPFVEQVHLRHEEHQETVILRYILKHLRQRRLLTPYQEIISRAFPETSSSASSPYLSTNPFEHPTLTQLHKSLVLQGDYPVAETLLSSCASQGLLSEAILQFQPSAEWSRIDSDALKEEFMQTDEVNEHPTPRIKPSPRGGHAMCLDRANGLIYMFGGWDGRKSLDDFWVMNVRERQWRLISTSRNSSGDIHPGPRACHKMVFDDNTAPHTTITTTAASRLSEGASPASLPLPGSPPSGNGSSPPPAGNPSPAIYPWSTPWSAEFFRYHTRGGQSGKWELISRNTSAEHGPPLIFDHQMVIDTTSQMIYVYGGRVVDGDWESIKYSGLYSYDIKTGRWKMLNSPDNSSTHPFIPSRFGHSMVLEPSTQTLFIFAGQRDDGYLSDMYTYHIPSNTVTELFSNFTTAGGPDACFTQRALIDTDLREIYVLCGLTKGPPGALSVLEKDSPYWIYRYKRPDQPGKWTKILSLSSPPNKPEPTVGPAPLPRYAHQAVYDNETKTIYMHGGNAGLEKDTEDVVRSGGDGDDDSRQSAPPATRDIGVGTDARREERHVVGGDGEENRLDDFWSLRLKRPDSIDIVRRGKYIIRQQRFRELCEDDVPVKALSYLKTEVSAVVNHSDPDEGSLFRSLLSHLLTPSFAKQHDASSSLASGPSAAKGRSRPDTPSNGIDEDATMTDSDAEPSSSGVTTPISSSVLLTLRLFEEDPSETRAQGEVPPPSAARYRQRTQVFEELLQFVNEDVRQPDRDLLELINIDQMGQEI
ncbi:unnamed protein product [Somion occarium]|uniref:Muskelin N-terminal domain-containing protein n=1 Tax=Somion occarium TaxID=3059160 RepID=A0ABP1DET0_9APHY